MITIWGDQRGSFAPNIGLNIQYGSWRRPWVTLELVTFNSMSAIMTSRRIRFRLFMRPFIITGRHSWSPIAEWLEKVNMIAVDMDVLADEAPRLHAIAKCYRYQGIFDIPNRETREIKVDDGGR